MPHLFFVSYSRINAKYPTDAELIRKLVDDLKADLDQEVPRAAAEVCFFDKTNIETGSDWNDELSEAAGRSRVALALFSPSYFTSVWCGREFQVFLDRRNQAAAANPGEAPKAVIPVLWMRPSALPEAASEVLPKAAGAIQNTDDKIRFAAFTPEYEQIGLRQIMRLKDEPEYAKVRFALAQRIVQAVKEARLPEIPNLDLRNYRSAWEEPQSIGRKPAGAVSVSKTYFVFLANDGWGWRPYAKPEPTVGAMAQTITGDIGLQYEEISCDSKLNAKLQEAKTEHVPTVLISDPSSLGNPIIKQAMKEYDGRLYFNCGLIVPWDVPIPTSDGRWGQLSAEVCPQKTRIPLPNHEWTSVSSPVLLKTKTLATIEELRMRMLNAVTASGANVAKAENDAVTEAAKARGISLQTTPVLANTSKTETS
jgi:hypothetical protein